MAEEEVRENGAKLGGSMRCCSRRRLRVSGVGRASRRPGAQHPLYRSYKRDQKKVDAYLNKRFPQIRRLARERGAVIYFVDEASVKADEHRGTTWGKIWQTPVIKDTGDRYSINLISAVSPRGDMKFRAFEGSMNQDMFLEFLVDLLKDTRKPIIVIADNASYHTGGFAKKCAEKSNDLVSLFYLPA